MLYVKALILIHMRVERMDYLYPYVQLLVIRLDSYVLLETIEFNTVRRFVMITYIKLGIVF